MHAWPRLCGCVMADLTCVAGEGSGRGKGLHRLGRREAAVARLQQRLIPTASLHPQRLSQHCSEGAQSFVLCRMPWRHRKHSLNPVARAMQRQHQNQALQAGWQLLSAAAGSCAHLLPARLGHGQALKVVAALKDSLPCIRAATTAATRLIFSCRTTPAVCGLRLVASGVPLLQLGLFALVAPHLQQQMSFQENCGSDSLHTAI